MVMHKLRARTAKGVESAVVGEDRLAVVRVIWAPAYPAEIISTLAVYVIARLQIGLFDGGSAFWTKFCMRFCPFLKVLFRPFSFFLHCFALLSPLFFAHSLPVWVGITVKEAVHAITVLTFDLQLLFVSALHTAAVRTAPHIRVVHHPHLILVHIENVITHYLAQYFARDNSATRRVGTAKIEYCTFCYLHVAHLFQAGLAIGVLARAPSSHILCTVITHAYVTPPICSPPLLLLLTCIRTTSIFSIAPSISSLLSPSPLAPLDEEH
mmetsp:Transcript_48040/g.124787  ORF Transcript_48040/g.124787 Transcript_48040/m.124787 type:complete len:267 (+) Transcript_48040:671-1471(+)